MFTQILFCYDPPINSYCFPIFAGFHYECSTSTAVLWEGNNIEQAIVAEIDIDQPNAINFTSNNCCTNDEARSMSIHNMTVGQTIILYNDSNGSLIKDRVEVVALQDFVYAEVNTFEADYTDLLIDVNYIFRDGELDGKVSRFEND